MKIAIIYGNRRKGSTYNCVGIIKRTLQECGEVSFQEFYLPTDLPQHCLGCFNCILKGEEFCPHRDHVSPIVEALVEADGIILASPAYGLDVSGAMKTLIDHLCFMWIPHRPHPEMFNKIGFVVSTAAGMGSRRANKTMKLALDYLGVKRVFSFGTSVAASSWENVKEQKKAKIEKALARKAKGYHKALVNRKRLRNRLFAMGIFKMIRGLLLGYEDGNVDKEYWKDRGWLGKKKPF